MVAAGAVLYIVLILLTGSFKAKSQNVDYLSYKVTMIEKNLFKLEQKRSALEKELRECLETLSGLDRSSVKMDTNVGADILMSEVENIQTSLVEEKLHRFHLSQAMAAFGDWFTPGAARQQVTNTRNRTLRVINQVSFRDEVSCVCGMDMEGKIKSRKTFTTTTTIPTAKIPTTTADRTTTTTTTTTTASPVIHPTERHNPGRGVMFSGTPLNDNGEELANDCGDLWEHGYRENGVYRLQIANKGSVLVFCNLKDTANNWGVGSHRERQLRGWILVQSRKRGVQDFNKTWEEYKNGFGDFSSEFWLGNELLFRFFNTSSVAPLLFLRLYTDENDDGGDHGEQSSYHKFFINSGLKMYPEEQDYKLFYSSYIHAPEIKYQGPGRGVFLTWDRQAKWPGCPFVKSGWWYHRSRCDKMRQNPNSKYTMVGRKPVLGYEYNYYNTRTKKHKTIVVTGSELLVYARTD